MKNVLLIALTLIVNFVNAQTFTKYVDNTQSNGQGFCYNVTIRLTLLRMAAAPTIKSAGNNTEYTVELVKVDVDKNKGWYQGGKLYNCAQLDGICNEKNFSSITLQLAYNCGGKEIGSNSWMFYSVGEKQTMELQPKAGCSSPAVSGIDMVSINNNDNASIINYKIQQLNKKTVATGQADNNDNPLAANSKTSNKATPASNDLLVRLDKSADKNSSQTGYETVKQISDVVTPLIENWDAKREQKYEERKKVEEQKKDITRSTIIKQGTTTSQLYEKMAEAGDVKAMVYAGAGFCYTNTEKFYYWLKKAAALNDAEAYWTLYYMNPGGDPLNIMNAPKTAEQIKWLHQAAELKNDIAMLTLWFDIYSMKKSPYYNPDKALEYLLIAAANGNLESKSLLALFYEEGKLAYRFSNKKFKNPAKAIETYEALSKLNDQKYSPRALGAIANMYEMGIGVKKDKAKAEQYRLQQQALRLQLGEVFYIYGNYRLKGMYYYSAVYQCYAAYGKKDQGVAEAKELLEGVLRKTATQRPELLYVNEILFVDNIDRAKVLYQFIKVEAAANEDITVQEDIAFAYDKRSAPASSENGALTPIKAGW